MSGTVCLTITSDTANLAALRESVSQVAHSMGFEEAQIKGIALAVDEAVTNIIRHGYDGQPGKPIDIELAPQQVNGRHALLLVLRDLGRQVDPGQIVGRNLHDIRPGGLGTHIIRSMMDEVEYSRRETGGMQLRMIKYVEPMPEHTPGGPSADGESEHAD